eukprot:CAMPEP_0197035692 /NCGR_PEP_ID=MMETSP1384-20130603/13408_1 /TAXON_ID=29189 /ORGANISM="Ammonia sp." /LENGTH=1045 /DNA_ID=CAMNT_0042465783 /DNA_START=126 /DNA_END=3263 /DNA_ORIENTATION=-
MADESKSTTADKPQPLTKGKKIKKKTKQDLLNGADDINDTFHTDSGGSTVTPSDETSTGEGEDDISKLSKKEMAELLRRERAQWLQERAALQKENEELKKHRREDLNKKIERPHPFWKKIVYSLRTDPDYVKTLIKNKELSFNDIDHWGKNILTLAAREGSYEIVQFCINLGADLNYIDNFNNKAVFYAQERGFYHIEQLLLFNQMNANAGNEVQGTADLMLKQAGINENILTALREIGEETMAIFSKTLLELMIRSISKKDSFSDDMLNLCWCILQRNGEDPLLSEFWLTIKRTCSDIVRDGNKEDWYWLKQCVLPSTIWYQDISREDEEQHYLYYELLKIVSNESKAQLDKLAANLNVFAVQWPNDWSRLTKWNLPDQYERVRQDVVPNGIVSTFTHGQLSESSNALFNSPRFYDHNQYLSQLVLVAQMVDDSFHESVQQIFQINKLTNVGGINFAEKAQFEPVAYDDQKQEKKHGDGVILYTRGPVKLMERAKYKAENDYANEPYPASACVLDLNRCSLIFNDISTMLAAVDLFVNKIRYYQSGAIIGIVRNKNGFIEYVQETQYADIKLNVLIKGTRNNIIGEVQFLLQTMKDYKDKAHNLYAIERQRETIESSVSQILPLLLDKKKRITIASNMGDVNAFCRSMVIDGSTRDDIMYKQADNGRTTLHTLCDFGHIKALRFVRSLLSEEEFLSHLFAPDVHNRCPMEYATRSMAVLEYLFQIKAVKAKYAGNLDLQYGIIAYMFEWITSGEIIDYVLKQLNITHKVHEIMKERYRQLDVTLFDLIVLKNTLQNFQKLAMLVGGEQTFRDEYLFEVNEYDCNVLEVAVEFDVLDVAQYIFSLNDVKVRYLKDDQLLWKMMYFGFTRSSYRSTIKTVLLDILQLSKEKMIELLCYQCPPAAESKKLREDAHPYHKVALVARMVNNKMLDSLQYLRELLDDDEAFGKGALHKDAWNHDALCKAISLKLPEYVAFVLSVPSVRSKYTGEKEKELLHAALTLLNQNWNDKVCQVMIKELQLTEKAMIELKAYKELDLKKIVNVMNR